MASMPSNQAWDALYGSGVVKNSASLSSDEYVVLARTDLKPLELRSHDGRPIRTIVPPNETIMMAFKAEERKAAFWKMGHISMRVMRFLAYSLKYPVPVFFVHIGKSLLFNEYHDRDYSSYYPPGLITQTAASRKEEDEWSDYLRERFSEARELLSRVETDSLMDRAITAVGTAFSADDPEFAYLGAWKGIELVADRDLKESARRFKVGMADDESAYFSQIMGKLFSGEKFKLDTLDKVKKTLLTRAAFDNSDEIQKYYNLRNKIAHSTPDAHDYQETISLLPALRNLSSLVVDAAVKGI